MITGAAKVAGVIGRPVAHSLSPLIHNAWIASAGLDAAYVPFASLAGDGFERLVDGLRGVISGLNVTVPFKERALALADRADAAARAAGAANVLLFAPDGTVEARNTDGIGLLAAFAGQAPALQLRERPIVVLGAGGAARGAAAALGAAGVTVRIVNRTRARADALAEQVSAQVFDDGDPAAFEGAGAVVNATTLGLKDGSTPAIPWAALPADAVIMDMVYQPLKTPLLQAAAARRHVVVDGLAMLIGQARPSFEAFFGEAPPDVDVRLLCLQALGET
jgi:shikimate dehydrogenase